MKKIGVLHGKERSFPDALVARVNSKNIPGIIAEEVRIDKVMQGEPTDYAVIFDRISQDVPFYRAYLKNAALMGTAVINNPFWWSADEKFFNNALAVRLVNLSPSGAMVSCSEIPHIGETVALALPDRASLPGAVRWVRDGCIGIHFADPSR